MALIPSCVAPETPRVSCAGWNADWHAGQT